MQGLNSLVKKATDGLESLAQEALGKLAQKRAFFGAAGAIVGYLLGLNVIVLWRTVNKDMDFSHFASIEWAILISLPVSLTLVGALIVAPRFK
jgi:hypothetical protein